ncbi:helix-turn-helix domain-containing protein [Saccharopolyspora sp. ID03-671]|uniref:GlxA family transcriptional regulator n=1 Tax=Saccharopolyspora sp. ID03-671 TaxID=3073066 RepID=UPI00324D1793
MHTVAALALPDTIAFDLATPMEVFRRARMPDGRAAYRVVVCGTEPLLDAGPIRIATDHGLDELARADTIVVPGRHDITVPTPPDALESLRVAAAAGTRVASICVGAFTLAEAGLLDGRPATTHWAASDLLAQRYPRVDVDPQVLYVDDGPVLTSAGASAGLDLCLHMIRRDHGTAVAADAARLAVAPLHRDGGQAQFIVHNPPDLAPATLEPLLGWIEEHAHEPLTLADLATAGRMSTRSLHRRFHAETGQSPVEWLTRVRVRHAQELLETTDHAVETISDRVGFASPNTFRTHFRRLAGVNPRTYRTTFRNGG